MTELEFEPGLVWLWRWLRCVAIVADNTGSGIMTIWGFGFLCGFAQVIKVPATEFAHL